MNSTLINPQNNRSSILLHHTRKFEALLSILTNGLKVYYSKEHFNTDFYAGIPMICFCDMPISRLSEHIESYGSYAIGFNKRRLMETYTHLLNPVNYLVSARQFKIAEKLRKEALDNYQQIKGFQTVSTLEELDKNIKKYNEASYLIGYMKRYGDYRIEKEYYRECEWRILLAENAKFETGESYNWIWNEDEFNKWHKEFIESGRILETNLPIMTFDIDDIDVIILNSVDERKQFIEFIKESTKIGGKDIPDDIKYKFRLMSKVRFFDEIKKNY